MTHRYQIHPDNPQLRLVRQVVAIIERGGIAAIPTGSSYALTCHLDDKAAVERLRAIRQLDEKQPLSLLCRDLKEASNYAKIDNMRYRLIKQLAPGPYTFILEATKDVPRRLSHPQRKTIGIRICSHPVVESILDVLGQPLIATTLQLPGDEVPLSDPDDICARLSHDIDVVADAGWVCTEQTTIIDVSGDQAKLIRQGAGPTDMLE